MKTSRVRALCARPARSGILALTAAAIVGGCAQEAPVAVAPVEIDRGTTCSLDGMILMDYPGPKAQIQYDRGPPDVFCDTVEMFSIYLKPEQQRRVRALFVQDMARADWNNPVDHWIDARTAFYVVGSKRHGSMGPTLASFSRETDARDFAAREGGKVYRFEQITPDMVVLDGGVLKDRMTGGDDVGDFYRNMRLDAAQQLEQLNRLAFELRESRRRLLQQYAVDSEAALLELIRGGAVAEHPGYDHYLGACVLATAREAVRGQLMAVLADL